MRSSSYQRKDTSVENIRSKVEALKVRYGEIYQLFSVLGSQTTFHVLLLIEQGYSLRDLCRNCKVLGLRKHPPVVRKFERLCKVGLLEKKGRGDYALTDLGDYTVDIIKKYGYRINELMEQRGMESEYKMLEKFKYTPKIFSDEFDRLMKKIREKKKAGSRHSQTIK